MADVKSASLFFLDKEGRWFHEGVEITHKRTILLFARNLSKGSEGRYYIRVGKEQAAVEVEDAPFMIRSVTIKENERGLISGFLLSLNDGTEEYLDPHTLMILDDNVMYCSVKSGTERARFLRSAYYQICTQIGPGEKENQFVLSWMEEKIPIPPGPNQTKIS